MTAALVPRVLKKLPLEVVFAAAQLIFLVNSVYVARYLGPELRGLLTTLTVWAQTLAFVAMLSIDKATISAFRSGAAATAAPQHLRWLRTRAFALSVFGLGLATCAGVVLEIGGAVLAGLVIATVAAGLTEAVHGWLLSQSKMGLWILSRLLQPSCLLLATLCVGLVAESDGPAASGLAIGLAVSFLVPLLIVAGLSGYFVRVPTKIESAARGQLWRNALVVQAGNVFQVLAARLDVLVAAVVLPIASVGLYSVALAGPQVLVLLGSAGMVRALSGRATGQRGKWAVASIYAAGLMVLLLVPDQLTRLIFGAQFGGLDWVIRVLALGAIASVVLQHLSGVFIARGNSRHYVMSQAIGLVVTASTLACFHSSPIAFASASACGAWVAALVAYATSVVDGERAPAFE